MNRLGFIILSILHKREATCQLSAMTVQEVASSEEFGVKENTIFKKMKEFESCGYVSRGLKEGRAATYYITPEGCEYLEEQKRRA